MAVKHKDKVDNLNYSTAAKAYLATQIELDLALEKLINTLEEKCSRILFSPRYMY